MPMAIEWRTLSSTTLIPTTLRTHPRASALDILQLSTPTYIATPKIIMSTTTHTTAAQPNDYLAQDLRSLMHREDVSPALRDAAKDTLSFLSRSKLSGPMRETKLRLIQLPANTVNLTVEEHLNVYAVQCKLRKIGANIVHDPMDEIYRSVLEEKHNFDWKTGIRIPGRRGEGASLSNNTFVSPLANGLYRALTFDDKGKASEKIIGEAGLSDRLGEEPTLAEIMERAKPCRAKRASIEKTLGWVRRQPEGSFDPVPRHDNATIYYSNAATRLSTLLGFAGTSAAKASMYKQRNRILHSDFNKPFNWPETTHRRSTVDKSATRPETTPKRTRTQAKKWTRTHFAFESIATAVVASAILSHHSCGQPARDLISMRPDHPGAMLLDFEIDADDQPDISRSHWVFPSSSQISKSANPVHWMYDSVEFHDGTVKTREITAGELHGMLVREEQSGGGSVGEAGSRGESANEQPEVSQAKRRRIEELKGSDI